MSSSTMAMQGKVVKELCSERIYPSCKQQDYCRPSHIQRMLTDRYCKWTSIYVNDDSRPVRYCHDDSEYVPSRSEHHEVKVMPQANDSTIFDITTSSMWQSLSDSGRDQLFVILRAVESLWHHVKYSYDRMEWVQRESQPSSEETHSCLVQYGKKTPNGESVLAYLAQGRDEEYLASLQNFHLPTASPYKLEDYWELALTSGMTNGNAHLAVCRLLEMLIATLSGLENEQFPKVWLLNVTSSSKSDAFSDSSASSSCPVTRSGDQKHKRTKLEVEQGGQNSKRQRLKGNQESFGQGDATYAESKPGHDNSETQGRITVNRQYLDIALVSHEMPAGLAKYLLLVEIHSEGETFVQAKNKFMNKMIHVLQCQNVVYGVLFSKDVACLYIAHKHADQRILITELVYMLPVIPLFSEKHDYLLDVGTFQHLVMDIFSCIVYGLKSTDA